MSTNKKKHGNDNDGNYDDDGDDQGDDKTEYSKTTFFSFSLDKLRIEVADPKTFVGKAEAL